MDDGDYSSILKQVSMYGTLGFFSVMPDISLEGILSINKESNIAFVDFYSTRHEHVGFISLSIENNREIDVQHFLTKDEVNTIRTTLEARSI